jgi:hypothetical protein
LPLPSALGDVEQAMRAAIAAETIGERETCSPRRARLPCIDGGVLLCCFEPEVSFDRGRQPDALSAVAGRPDEDEPATVTALLRAGRARQRGEADQQREVTAGAFAPDVHVLRDGQSRKGPEVAHPGCLLHRGASTLGSARRAAYRDIPGFEASFLRTQAD